MIIQPIMRVAMVNTGLYIGSQEAARSSDWLAMADISAIINLSNKPFIATMNTCVIDFHLPNQELLDSEIPKTLAKLEVISEDLANLRAIGHNVLVICEDGLNKAPLAVGHYLITKQRQLYSSTVDCLEVAYLPKDNPAGVHHQKDGCPAGERCLSMTTFRKVLRLAASPK